MQASTLPGSHPHDRGGIAGSYSDVLSHRPSAVSFVVAQEGPHHLRVHNAPEITKEAQLAPKRSPEGTATDARCCRIIIVRSTACIHENGLPPRIRSEDSVRRCSRRMISLYLLLSPNSYDVRFAEGQGEHDGETAHFAADRTRQEQQGGSVKERAKGSAGALSAVRKSDVRARQF